MRGRLLAFAAGRATAKNRDQQQTVQQDAAPAQQTQTEKLEELGKLHNDGVLTDEEFSQEKKKVLSGK